MASRPLRGRRQPSPEELQVATRMPIKKESSTESRDEVLRNGWVEPAPRTPVASFEEHKGLERHGVLEHMAPLGQFPGQKLKQKMKYQETQLRKPAVARNGDVAAVQEEAKIESATAPSASRKTEKRKPLAPAKARSTQRGGKDDKQEPSRSYGYSLANPTSKQTPTPAARNGAGARMIGDQTLKEIVESAVLRASEVGNPKLGQAIQLLYDQSERDSHLEDLMVATMSYTQTPEQADEFQVYVRKARRDVKLDDKEKVKKKKPGKVEESSSRGDASSVNKTAATVAEADARSNNVAAPDKNTRPLPTASHVPSTSTPIKRKKEVNNPSSRVPPPAKEGRSSKQRKRTDSQSSISSLSSVGSAARGPKSSAANAAPLGTSSPARATQRSLNHLHDVEAGRSMSSSKQQPLTGHKSSSPMAAPADRETPPEEANATKRRKLRHDGAFEDYKVTESNIRPSIANSTPAQRPSRLSTPNNSRQPQSRLRNGAAQRNKRYQEDDDDDDDALSSVPSSPGDLLVPPPHHVLREDISSQMAKAGKGAKKTARVKTSPVKKRTGTTAGIAKRGEADTPAHTTRQAKGQVQVPESADDCTSCGGGGKLLCCDHCALAYHFTCLEPPLDETPEGDWACPRCSNNDSSAKSTNDDILKESSAKDTDDDTLKDPSAKATHVDIFKNLIKGVTYKTPNAYSLPNDLRDFYEGVRTGEDGEYDDIRFLKADKLRHTQNDNKDNFKLTDSKGRFIHCHSCKESSMSKNPASTLPDREMIQCDFCDLSWHLDCLDPPLANAPVKKPGPNGTRTHWMCPAHVEKELGKIRQPPAEYSGRGPKPPAGRSYRLRKPKNPIIRDIGYRRGLRNNGYIEIINDPTDEEEDEINNEVSGTIYRLKEETVKLDFGQRIWEVNEVNRQANAAAARAAERARRKATKKTIDDTQATAATEKVPFAQRKAALNLLQLADGTANFDRNKLLNLINTLEAEAPDEVVNAVTASEASQQAKSAAAISDEERRDLQTLLAMIQRRLAGGQQPVTKEGDTSADKETVEEVNNTATDMTEDEKTIEADDKVAKETFIDATEAANEAVSGPPDREMADETVQNPVEGAKSAVEGVEDATKAGTPPADGAINAVPEGGEKVEVAIEGDAAVAGEVDMAPANDADAIMTAE